MKSFCDGVNTDALVKLPAIMFDYIALLTLFPYTLPLHSSPTLFPYTLTLHSSPTTPSHTSSLMNGSPYHFYSNKRPYLCPLSTYPIPYTLHKTYTLIAMPWWTTAVGRMPSSILNLMHSLGFPNTTSNSLLSTP